jgi:hypothetical protein
MQGKIQTLNVWKSNKGFFMRVNNKEYSSFGVPTVQVGDEIDFEDGGVDKNKPNMRFAQNIKKLDIEAFVNDSVKRTMSENKVTLCKECYELELGSGD